MTANYGDSSITYQNVDSSPNNFRDETTAYSDSSPPPPKTKKSIVFRKLTKLVHSRFGYIFCLVFLIAMVIYTFIDPFHGKYQEEEYGRWGFYKELQNMDTRWDWVVLNVLLLFHFITLCFELVFYLREDCATESATVEGETPITKKHFFRQDDNAEVCCCGCTSTCNAYFQAIMYLLMQICCVQILIEGDPICFIWCTMVWPWMGVIGCPIMAIWFVWMAEHGTFGSRRKSSVSEYPNTIRKIGSSCSSYQQTTEEGTFFPHTTPGGEPFRVGSDVGSYQQINDHIRNKHIHSGKDPLHRASDVPRKRSTSPLLGDTTYV